MRTLLTSLVLAAMPAAAHAAEPVRVDRDGYQLEYVVTRQADGSKLIVGRELRKATEFSLIVKGRSVTGEVGGRDVAFTAPRSKARKGTLVASK